MQRSLKSVAAVCHEIGHFELKYEIVIEQTGPELSTALFSPVHSRPTWCSVALLGLFLEGRLFGTRRPSTLACGIISRTAAVTSRVEDKTPCFLNWRILNLVIQSCSQCQAMCQGYEV